MSSPSRPMFRALQLWRDMEADVRKIVRREHSKGLRKHRDCFTGAEVVTQVLAFLQAQPEERFNTAARHQACALSQKLLTQGTLLPVKGCEGLLRDSSKYFYRLAPSKASGSSSPRTPRARRRAPTAREFPTPLRDYLEGETEVPCDPSEPETTHGLAREVLQQLLALTSCEASHYGAAAGEREANSENTAPSDKHAALYAVPIDAYRSGKPQWLDPLLEHIHAHVVEGHRFHSFTICSPGIKEKLVLSTIDECHAVIRQFVTRLPDRILPEPMLFFYTRIETLFATATPTVASATLACFLRLLPRRNLTLLCALLKYWHDSRCEPARIAELLRIREQGTTAALRHMLDNPLWLAQAASECVWVAQATSDMVSAHLASLCADLLAGGTADESVCECDV